MAAVYAEKTTDTVQVFRDMESAWRKRDALPSSFLRPSLLT